MNKGIDVSAWQGTIDWEKVKSQINYAILRLGFIGNKNNHTLDKQFERNYSECKRLGIPVGVYIYNYCNSEQTIKSGAEWTIKKLTGKSLELPVYIDMEDTTLQGLGKEKLTNMCIAFNSIIEKSGFWAGVYANAYWFNNLLNKEEIKRRYTTWIAHYDVNIEKYNGEYDMLQYSSKGAVNGMNGNIDMNNMYRDLISAIKGNLISNTQNDKKTIDELANEVIAGKYGNDETRKQALGSLYNEVQSRVNEILEVNQKKQITYVVKKGDTLTKIAKKYNTTVDSLAKKNNIADKNKIQIGQVLYV